MHATVTSKPKKKNNDTMTMKFLLHKEKEMKCHRLNSTFGKPCPQADTSFAKRAISTVPRKKNNLTEKRILEKPIICKTDNSLTNRFRKLNY